MIRASTRYCLWLGIVAAALLGGLWDFYPLPDAQRRLDETPRCSPRFAGADVALTQRERGVFGRSAVLHRRYQFGSLPFYLTMIDGTRYRHAVHDPRYCFQGAGWSTAVERRVKIPGGSARWFRMRRDQNEAEVVFWFSDGTARYDSFLKYWCQTTLRRMTFGRFGAEPVLVVLQCYGSEQPTWPELLKDAVAELRL